MGITNHKVVNYARSQVGKRVFAEAEGALGECWDLAFQALKEAGAKTPHDFGRVNTYKWSSRTISLSQAEPGDIIQYKNLKIEVVKVTVRTLPDGSTETLTETSTFEIGLPRHTAIIKAIKPNGVVEVYEQNIGGVKHTAVNEYHLKPGTYEDGATTITVTKKKGSYKIYRPEPKEE